MIDEMRGRWSGFLDHTVWGRSYIEEEVPERYRSLYTVALPLQLLCFIVFGTLGTIANVPSVQLVAGVDYVDIWAALLAVIGAATFCALVFRFHWAELVAMIFLVAGLLSYPVSVALLAIGDQDLDRWALAAGLPALLVLPAWRVGDLSVVLRRELAARRAAKARL